MWVVKCKSVNLCRKGWKMCVCYVRTRKRPKLDSTCFVTLNSCNVKGKAQTSNTTQTSKVLNSARCQTLSLGQARLQRGEENKVAMRRFHWMEVERLTDGEPWRGTPPWSTQSLICRFNIKQPLQLRFGYSLSNSRKTEESDPPDTIQRHNHSPLVA